MRVVVTVSNQGTIVEGYRVEVLGDLTGAAPDLAGPATWSEVLPTEGGRSGEDGEPAVTVFPGQLESVVVMFSPPVGPLTTRHLHVLCQSAVRSLEGMLDDLGAGR